MKILCKIKEFNNTIYGTTAGVIISHITLIKIKENLKKDCIPKNDHFLEWRLKAR